MCVSVNEQNDIQEPINELIQRAEEMNQVANGDGNLLITRLTFDERIMDTFRQLVRLDQQMQRLRRRKDRLKFRLEWLRELRRQH